MAEPVIRPARADEIDQVGELWGEMYAFQRAHGMMLPLRDDAVDIYKREIAGRLDTALAVVLVCEGEAPVGSGVAGETSTPGASGIEIEVPAPGVSGHGTGPLAGFLAAQTRRLPPHLAVDNPKVGYIAAVYVRPEARRQRAGRALVDAAFAWFRRAEVGSVELEVIHGNELARAFWAELGFEVELVRMRTTRF
jgi:ribosomal protein S18 acetylase RimI-like enzyme